MTKYKKYYAGESMRTHKLNLNVFYSNIIAPLATFVIVISPALVYLHLDKFSTIG